MLLAAGVGSTKERHASVGPPLCAPARLRVARQWRLLFCACASPGSTHTLEVAVVAAVCSSRDLTLQSLATLWRRVPARQGCLPFLYASSNLQRLTGHLLSPASRRDYTGRVCAVLADLIQGRNEMKTENELLEKENASDLTSRYWYGRFTALPRGRCHLRTRDLLPVECLCFEPLSRKQTTC